MFCLHSINLINLPIPPPVEFFIWLSSFDKNKIHPWFKCSLYLLPDKKKMYTTVKYLLCLCSSFFFFKASGTHAFHHIIIAAFIRRTAYELLLVYQLVLTSKKKINIVLLCTFCKFHRCCNIGYDGYPFTNEKYIYRYLLMIFKFIAWCSVGLLWNKASNLFIRQIDQDLWRQRGTTDPCYWTQRVSIVELSDT